MGTVPLLVALLGAPLVWMVHLAASYFLVALHCGTGWTGARIAIALVTLLGALAAAATGLFAWRRWKRIRPVSGAEPLDPIDTTAFLLLSGAVLAALFTGAIVLTGLSPLFLPMCA